MKKSNRTEEQEIIIDRLNYIDNSIGVRAFAGTGKSFLLKEATIEYPKLKFLGLAFNSSIVAENSLKFPKENSLWLTVHGLARTYFQNAKFDIGNIKDYNIIEIIKMLKIKDNNYVLASATMEIFDLFCNSDLKEIRLDDILKTARRQKKIDIIHFDLEFLNEACGKAKELWNLFVSRKINMTHSFYLKLFEVKELARNIKNFDFVLLDEAQDSNPVTLSIVNQIPAKKIFVGDPHQSIYAFRGVVNAIETAEEQHYLSTTFRYQNHIANRASDILENYRNERKRITSMASKSKDDNSRAILFRNNSSMIEAIDGYIKNNIKYKTFKDPSEFFKTSIAIYNFKEKKEYPKSKSLNYFNNFRNYEELKEYIKESGDSELKTADKMQERYKKAMFYYLSDAKKRFAEKDKDSLILCTGHVSKGLEWGYVDIFHDFKDIDKMMAKHEIVNAVDLQFKSDEDNSIANAIIQEINLNYVAVTRAKHTVRYINKDGTATLLE